MSPVSLTATQPNEGTLPVKQNSPSAAVTLLPVAGFQAYLWRDASDTVLIDAGPVGGLEELVKGLAAVGAAPGDIDLIVLTHFHDDHVGGVAELLQHTDARVVAHRADAPVIRGDRSGPPPNFTIAERELHEVVAADLRPAPPCRVDVEVTGGEVLPFGGGARVVETPGHTDGSIAIHLPESGVLFSGDILAEHLGEVIPGVFNLHTPTVHRSIQKLASLEPESVYFGHGRPLTSDAADVLSGLAASL